jgi:hypothetical protein
MRSAKKQSEPWPTSRGERYRLKQDGAHSNEALQRRVRALAHERNIPPADYAKLMYKRISTRDFLVFCEKHKVNCDWLLLGDLAGLQRMTRERKAQEVDELIGSISASAK